MDKDIRPLRTDGEATYNRILEAAGRLFAASGFAETTSKAIAQAAEVDLASINYHFGNRAGLYRRVLAEAHRRVIRVDELERLRDSDLPAQEKLRALIAGLVRAAADEEGWHARVLSRELLSPTSHLTVLWEDEIAPKAAIATSFLSEITGLPADDPSLLPCLMSVIAPCAMMLVAGREVPPLAEILTRLSQEDLVDHFVRFAMGGLAAVRG
ncbi:CerR family C-terminal domain-containing protein [Acuticoccus kandeliae]|uniref:CerR family C-terminal domain-containing protein n=1 Tax=Acuticoccus kandeliae TaxID=2073160 RepID=UPI000D3E6F2A|nr:CerR family C-terminal domain-containing protein [Acuticoccus kandeliae]